LARLGGLKAKARPRSRGFVPEVFAAVSGKFYIVVFQILALFPFNNGDFVVIERTSTEVWRRSWRRVGFDEAAAAEDAD
jgi:hypothetical protein